MRVFTRKRQQGYIAHRPTRWVPLTPSIPTWADPPQAITVCTMRPTPYRLPRVSAQLKPENMSQESAATKPETHALDGPAPFWALLGKTLENAPPERRILDRPTWVFHPICAS